MQSQSSSEAAAAHTAIHAWLATEATYAWLATEATHAWLATGQVLFAEGLARPGLIAHLGGLPTLTGALAGQGGNSRLRAPHVPSNDSRLLPTGKRTVRPLALAELRIHMLNWWGAGAGVRAAAAVSRARRKAGCVMRQVETSTQRAAGKSCVMSEAVDSASGSSRSQACIVRNTPTATAQE